MRAQNRPASLHRVHTLRPRPPQIPLWLRQLVLLQRGSSIAALTMGGLALLAYSWSVHSQRAWTQAYTQLSDLRRDEPQLMRTNEVLKEHLAQQAEAKSSGLIEPTAANILYLEPEALRPDRVLPPAEPPAPLEAPLGY
ncbi:MAG: hypothetical protein HC771_08660 [Synechococcales cyanobacterium CRU_2_2]|nr:hypothetical protein [Synechococcales cyanobacterium CRU_2_2]